MKFYKLNKQFKKYCNDAYLIHNILSFIINHFFFVIMLSQHFNNIDLQNYAIKIYNIMFDKKNIV